VEIDQDPETPAVDELEPAQVDEDGVDALRPEVFHE